MDELDQAVSSLQKAEDARLGGNGELGSQEDLLNAIKTEKHAMLVINELCSHMVPFEPGRDYDKDIDLVDVAESLSSTGLSVKQTQKSWEQLRKRLRDVQKRESEFITLTRMEVMEDFCFDQSNQFKKRMKVYEKEIAQMAERDDTNDRGSSLLNGLDGCETKTRHLIESFNDLMMNRSKDDFIPKSTEQRLQDLRASLNKCRNYMEDFQSQLNDLGTGEASPDAEKPSTLTNLFTNIYQGLEELTGGPSKAGKGGENKPKSPDWYDSEIATLIFGVIRLGDKDLTDIMNETVFIRHEIEQVGKPLFIGNKRRSPAEIAQKWQEIKALRNLDVNRFRLQLEKSGKIVTERDWMIAALLALTKQPEQESTPAIVEQSTALESKPSITEAVEEEKKDEPMAEEGKETKESVPEDAEKGQKAEV